MNAKSIALAALFATVSIGAYASEASEGPIGASLKSREEVRAAVQAAIKDGSYVQTNEGASLPALNVESTLDRATVRQEAVDALRRPSKNLNALYLGG